MKYIQKLLFIIGILMLSTCYSFAISEIISTKINSATNSLEYSLSFTSDRSETVNVYLTLQNLGNSTSTAGQDEVFNYGVVNLKSGTNLLSVKYAIPDYIKTGKYVLYLSTKDPVSGIAIDPYRYIDKVNIINDVKIKALNIKDCNIYSATGTKTSINNTLLYDRNSPIKVECSVNKDYLEDIYYRIETFKKSYGGESVGRTEGVAKIKDSRISFDVNINLDPDWYATAISIFNKDKQKLAENINARYIIKGENATINLLGVSTASSKNIMATIAGPVSNFILGSNKINSDNYSYTLTVKDSTDNICSTETGIITFDKNIYNLKSVYDLEKCDSKEVFISLEVMTPSGKVLSSKNISYANSEVDTDSLSAKNMSNIKLIALMSLITILLIAIIVYKKISIKTAAGSALMLMLITTNYNHLYSAQFSVGPDRITAEERFYADGLTFGLAGYFTVSSTYNDSNDLVSVTAFTATPFLYIDEEVSTSITVGTRNQPSTSVRLIGTRVFDLSSSRLANTQTLTILFSVPSISTSVIDVIVGDPIEHLYSMLAIPATPVVNVRFQ